MHYVKPYTGLIMEKKDSDQTVAAIVATQKNAECSDELHNKLYKHKILVMKYIAL
jgi:hypothetical protein